MQGDYCKVVQRGTAYPTVIAFSSVNTPQGKYKPYRIVAEAHDINIIFVNDAANRWYQHGIPGVADTALEAATQLASEARRIGNGRVITFGTSMGAYGAALFGALGKVDGCMVFGVESPLNLPGSRSQLYMPSGQSLPYPALAPLVEIGGVPTLVYASETDEVDLVSAATLVDLPNVTAISIRGMDHPGVQVFDIDNSIRERITTFAKHGTIPDGFSKQGWILQQRDLIAGLWEAYQAKSVAKDRVLWLEVARRVAEQWPRSATAHLRLGEALYGNSDGPGAEAAWRAALAICPYQFESMTKLGNYLRRHKKIDEALPLLTRCVEINPWNAHGHHSLGEAYAEMGQLDSAERHLRKAVGLNRGNKAFKRSLAEFLTRSAKSKIDEADMMLASIT